MDCGYVVPVEYFLILVDKSVGTLETLPCVLDRTVVGKALGYRTPS